MRKLARHIRFSINPFLEDSGWGANSYCSKPCGEGYSLYFGLWVELFGPVDEDTGFVVNVVEIDRQVRTAVIPIFIGRIGESFRKSEHVTISALIDILKESWGKLVGGFGEAKVEGLVLELNPFRKIAINAEDCKVYYLSEKFEFAATHKLWNDKFSDEKNLEVFGKCANAAGHGHNYVVEVTVERPLSQEEYGIGAFEQVIEDEFLSLVDHKNLNVEVPEFADMNPTVENIARLAWDKLRGNFGDVKLSSVTVWENDKTYCTYSG